MYKPNFCAECGAQILRASWHFWTSRRFCEECAPRFQKQRVLLPLVLSACLLTLGFTLGRAMRPSPPPRVVERGASLPLVAPPASNKNAAAAASQARTTKEALATREAESVYGPNGTLSEQPTHAREIVSICGARTQKGTPCQRRVRGTGRCWQHKGMPAMLPPSKLILQDERAKEEEGRPSLR